MKSSSKAIILAILIVLFICLMSYTAGAGKQPGWAHLDYWKAHYVEDPDQIYERSAGGFDEAAALALRRSEEHPNPSAEDHLRAATIIHRNIISQENRTTNRDLSRLRLDMFGRARGHYMAALAGLTDHTIARGVADQAVHRYRLPAGNQGENLGRLGAEHIIDAALEFAYGGLEALLNNDPFLAVLFTEEWGVAPFGVGLGGNIEPIPDVGMFGLGRPFEFIPDVAMADFAADRRNQTIQTRQAAAAEVAGMASGGSRGVQAAAFLDLSQRHTSDSQNSHDSSINASKRVIIERLRADQGHSDRLPSLDQIIEEIRSESDDFSRDPRTGYPRPALTDKAIAVVQRAKNGEHSTSARASDAETLRRVWARANDSNNADNSHKMRQAAYDALVDSWGTGFGGEIIQCVDGRISRMLGSLSWLDHDERNWDMRRLEQHKNDIYSLAAEVIRSAEVEAAEQNGNPELQKVGKAYLATTAAELSQIGPLNDTTEKAWISATRERVARAIDAHIAELNERAPGVIPGHAINGIKMEALAALPGE